MSFQKILKGEEGLALRNRHQKRVAYMKSTLRKAGLPQMKSASHIIPVHVGNPWICTRMSNELLSRFGHYVQAINYPTVAKGQERLRIAPTPFHSPQMIDAFVNDLVVVWKDMGLPLYDTCNARSCNQCNKLLDISFEALPCGARSDCPQLMIQI